MVGTDVTNHDGENVYLAMAGHVIIIYIKLSLSVDFFYCTMEQVPTVERLKL